jgi:hypothetical protein
LRRLAAIALAAAFAAAFAASAAWAQESVHGADSVFMSPSVRLAWAVRRGATEADTLVVVRVIAADNYRFIRLDGVDPFTKDRKVFAARPLDRTTDVAVPRVQFADHPSTEFRFFRTPEDASADRPALTVFYLGVPDTTPEFAGPREAEAYLDRALRPK